MATETSTVGELAAQLENLTGVPWRETVAGVACTVAGWRVYVTRQDGGAFSVMFYGANDNDPRETDTADTVRGVFALMITTANRHGWQWADCWA